MKYRTRIFTAALVGALAIAPAAASAHETPSPSTVKVHVRSADQALDRVESLVERNQDAKAAIQFVRNRRQMRAASRETRSLQRQARAERGAARAASATRLVAKQSNTNAETFAEIVDELSGKLQIDVARAATSDLRGREKALEILTRLIDRVPAAAKPGLARAIAALSSDGGDEVADLSAALAGGMLPPAAQQAVGQALAQALAAIDGAIERLNGIAALVPEQAQPHVQQAMERVTQQLQMVKQLLAGLFSGGGGQPGGGGLPIPSGLPVPSGVPIPSGVVPCGLIRLPIPGC